MARNDVDGWCNSFSTSCYRPILERELEQLGERGYVDVRWARTIGDLLRGPLGAALDQRRAFLLRVDRHSGAESVTLNGVRSIKIMKEKDNDGRQKFDYEAAPLTWWLAASDDKQRTDMRPFGWLLVEVSSLDQPAADWPNCARPSHRIWSACAPGRNSVRGKTSAWLSSASERWPSR